MLVFVSIKDRIKYTSFKFWGPTMHKHFFIKLYVEPIFFHLILVLHRLCGFDHNSTKTIRILMKPCMRLEKNLKNTPAP